MSPEHIAKVITASRPSQPAFHPDRPDHPDHPNSALVAPAQQPRPHRPPRHSPDRPDNPLGPAQTAPPLVAPQVNNLRGSHPIFPSPRAASACCRPLPHVGAILGAHFDHAHPRPPRVRRKNQLIATAASRRASGQHFERQPPHFFSPRAASTYCRPLPHVEAGLGAHFDHAHSRYPRVRRVGKIS